MLRKKKILRGYLKLYSNQDNGACISPMQAFFYIKRAKNLKDVGIALVSNGSNHC